MSAQAGTLGAQTLLAQIRNTRDTDECYLLSVDSQTIPLSILAGSASYNKLSGHWELVGPPSDEVDRRFVAPVLFERPFTTTPVVNLALCGFDISNADSARLRVRVEEITTKGFLVVAETWFNTQVYGFDVSWLAVGT